MKGLRTIPENETVRIQKYLSACGVASRRGAEDAIRAGEVKINGRIAEIGEKVMPGRDRITIRGRKVSMKAPEKVYLMLNKPRGYITTMHDEGDRHCVAELVSGVGTRVYPVGRLDKDSEGLLLFTNDGDFANTLMHPRHEIPKIYHVKVREKVTSEMLNAFAAIEEIDGYRIIPVRPEILREDENGTMLVIRLYEGRNRQIRKMCEIADLTVLRLKRVAIGSLALGTLRSGTWRELTQREIDYLLKGDQKSKHAGNQTDTR